MGGFQFATCERGRALEFLKVLYPDATIMDSPTSAGKVLDLVELDIIRIPDPMMHGKRVVIYPSKNWDDNAKDEVVSALQTFHDAAQAAGRP